MRILHVSDLHSADAHFEFVTEVCQYFDLVCLTGDLLDLNARHPVGDQIERVLAHLGTIPVPLAICSGNHDSEASLGPQLERAAWLKEARRKNVWIDGDSFKMGSHAFRCIPWNGTLPEDGANEIWLIHAPPDETPTGISVGGAGWGDFEFGELCRAGRGPRLALSGHVHCPQRWYAKAGRTVSLNPGRPDTASTLNYIGLDLARGVAARSHVSGDTDFLKF